jgi:hypothetical protein
LKGKEKENPTFSHCEKKGNEDETCWKMHPERIPKKIKYNGK